MALSVKEYYHDHTTGQVTIEYSDDSTKSFNMNDVVTAETDPVTGGIGLFVGEIDSGVVTSLGVYNYDRTGLRKFQRALAKVRAGVSDSKICTVGDSTDRGSIGGTWPAGGYGTSWPQRFASMLNSYFAPASCDNLWCDGALGNTNFDAYETRVARGAWFVDGAVTSAGGNVFKTSSGGTSGFVFTPAGTWDTVDIYLPIFKYNSSSYANNGVIGFQIDGAAPASGPSTFNTNTGDDRLHKITLTASAVGTHALKILQDSRAGYQTDIAGISCYASSQKRVLIQNMGWAGSRVDNWTANESSPSSPLSALKAVAPDLTTINLTINSLIAGQSVSVWSAEMQKIITAAKLSGDVILRIGNPTTTPETNHPGLAESFVAEAHVLAKNNGLLLLDTRARWADASSATSAGYLGADGVHPTATGYCDVAQFIFGSMRNRI